MTKFTKFAKLGLFGTIGKAHQSLALLQIKAEQAKWYFIVVVLLSWLGNEKKGKNVKGRKK